MNCRKIIKCYFSIVIAFSLTPQPKVFAQSNSTGCQATLNQLSNVQLAATPRLTAADVINDPDFVEQIGDQQQMLPTTSPFKSSATKDVSQFWQMRVSNDDVSIINASDVKYTLISSSETNNPFQENKVELRAFGSIETIDCSDNTSVITGGITLQFNELSELMPGRFQGDIRVCVPLNGVQCD